MFLINKLKERVMKKSRVEKLTHFYSLYNEGMTVLDVGVSSESKTGMSARNYFLKNFKYD